MKPILTEKYVQQEYTIRGKSDREIALALGVDRTAVVHFRKKYGIETKETIAVPGNELVIQHLRKIGFDVQDMKEKSKTHYFDLLVNQTTRVEFFCGKRCPDGRFRFSLTRRGNIGVAESNIHYEKLGCGRLRKNVANSCDVLILCGIDLIPVFFIIPSSEVPAMISTISVTERIGKWYKWRDRWDLINIGEGKARHLG